MSMDWDDLWNRPAGGDTAPPGTSNVVRLATGNGDTRYGLNALASEAAIVASTPQGQRNDALNRAWFRMGRLVPAHLNAATVRQALTDAARSAGLPESEIEAVLRDDSTSGLSNGQAVPREVSDLPDPPPVTVLELDTDVEAMFWRSRPILTHLHDYARSRRVSPWAVLGVTLARVITKTPHQVCLPPIVGGRASLNLFVGLVGPSGSGKGAAEAVAADALDVGYVETHTTGSGEGIAHGFRYRDKGSVEWRDDEHAVLFSVSEIDTLAAQGDRKGATLLPELRRGWSGEQLGFGYADPAKRLPVPAHEYRMCLVAGIQPARAGALLNDSDGGTPQRFLWLPATDPHAPDEPPAEPQRKTWRAPATGHLATIGGIKVDVCDEARTIIDEARLARLRGDGEALDGHALLARLKVAAALGILDGVYRANEDDWHLAGIIMRKSDAVRSAVTAALAAKAAETNAARAEAEASRAVHVSERLADAGIKRVCRAITRKLHREGDWTAASVVRKAVTSADRGMFDQAIDRLMEAGQIEVETTESGHGQAGTRYRIAGGEA